MQRGVLKRCLSLRHQRLRCIENSAPATRRKTDIKGAAWWERGAFADLLASRPDVVTVMLGTNDASDAVPKAMFANYERDLRLLVATLGAPRAVKRRCIGTNVARPSRCSRAISA